MAVNELQNTETLPRYEVIEYEGKPARLYPDGAIRNEKGHFIAQHPAGKDNQITSENARELQARRWMLATERTAAWITKEAQSIDPDIRDVADAHAFMWAKQYTTVIDSDKPRTDDAEKVSIAMGTMPRSVELRQEQAQRPANDPVGQALLTLIQALSPRNEVINGQVQIIDENDASTD